MQVLLDHDQGEVIAQGGLARIVSGDDVRAHPRVGNMGVGRAALVGAARHDEGEAEGRESEAERTAHARLLREGYLLFPLKGILSRERRNASII